METDSPTRSQWSRFLTLLIAMLVMAALLGTLLGILLSGIPHLTAATSPAQKAHRSGMVRLAVVCVALLGLTLVVIFWLVVRFLGSRFQPPPPHPPTEHVDAWSLAGKRMQVAEEEEEEGDEGDAKAKDGP